MALRTGKDTKELLDKRKNKKTPKFIKPKGFYVHKKNAHTVISIDIDLPKFFAWCSKNHARKKTKRDKWNESDTPMLYIDVMFDDEHGVIAPYLMPIRCGLPMVRQIETWNY